MCAQASIGKSSRGKNESGDSESEGEREDVLRRTLTTTGPAPKRTTTTTWKPTANTTTKGGLARRNLTTELESAAAELELESQKKAAALKANQRAKPSQIAAATASASSRRGGGRRVLGRDEFEVVMLVDTREIAGKGNGEGKGRKTIFQELLKRGVACEERSLALGDFLWIARDKRRGAEYVMDVIVERKKVDDMWASIKDGRYYEQKVNK